jgi:hypothetical protein
MYIMDTEHDVRGENAWTRENKYPSRDNLSRILKIVKSYTVVQYGSRISSNKCH